MSGELVTVAKARLDELLEKEAAFDAALAAAAPLVQLSLSERFARFRAARAKEDRERRGE